MDNSGNACCGAFLPGTPFYAQFFVAAMALSAALTLKEPVIHFATHVHSLKKTAGDIREALVEYADLRI